MSEPAPTPRRCLRCSKHQAARYAPFCSARCKDADLGAWLTEEYVIPVAPDDPEDKDGPQIAPPLDEE